MYVGGLGAGKSRAAVYKALTLGLKNAPCTVLFIEPTYVLIQDVAVPAFKQVFEELGVPFKYKINDHVMIVADKFEIMFRSGDQPDKIVGSNVGCAILDEPGIMSEDVYKKAMGRVRDPRAKQRQTVLVGTPEGLNYFWELSKDPRIEVIRAKTTDNTFLPPEYVTGLLERYTPEEVQSYINGEFISFDGAWYRILPEVIPHETMFNSVKIFKKPEHCSKQLVLGVDTGGGLGRDSSAFALVDKRDFQLVASWKHDTATIDEMCVLIRNLTEHYTLSTPVPIIPIPDQPGRSPQVVVEANGIGRATIQKLRSMKVSCVEVNTTEATRYENLQLAREKAASGDLKGPEELRKEAELLVTAKGKFEGPKDLSMAYGFAARFIMANPFIKPPDIRDARVFSMKGRLGKKRGGTW